MFEWIPVRGQKKERPRKIWLADVNDAIVEKGLGELDLTYRAIEDK